MRSLSLSLSLALVLFLIGCGNGNSITTDNPPTQPRAEIFDCEGELCDSSKQYCLVTSRQNQNLVVTHDCVSLPTNCADCSCAEQDAKKQFANSNNCSGWVRCDRKNSKIQVTCEVPPLGW